MLIILTALIVAAVLFWVTLRIADNHENPLLFAISAMGLTATAFCSIVFAIGLSGWIGATYRTTIINRECGTNYSNAEVYWASDLIDMVRGLDCKHIESNGNPIKSQVE